MNEQIVAYVRIPDIDDHLKMGWLYLTDLLGTPHGEWSVLMEWKCPCPIPQLKKP